MGKGWKGGKGIRFNKLLILDRNYQLDLLSRMEIFKSTSSLQLRVMSQQKKINYHSIKRKIPFSPVLQLANRYGSYAAPYIKVFIKKEKTTPKDEAGEQANLGVKMIQEFLSR